MPAGYSAALITSQGDGSALTASTSPTSILPAQAKFTLGAQQMDRIGRQFMVRAAGRVTTVTTPGTLTLDIRLGAVVAANSGTMVLSTTAKTNVAWELEWLLTLRSVGGGTSATFMHQGHWMSEAAGATTVAGEAKTIMLPQSAPAVGTGFDSTAAQLVDLFATWSISNADSITLHQYSLHDLG